MSKILKTCGTVILKYATQTINYYDMFKFFQAVLKGNSYASIST